MKKCNTKKVHHGYTVAKHEKSALQEKCNMKKVQHKKGVTGKK